ncbi:peptidase S8, partial [Nitrospirales bacterium NOB]|nr:peptidase S8 [Nitrospirales bacterium NOB]
MSAPAVTGLVALLTEQYKREQSGASPEPALLKALLLNTAKDLGNPGPDYTHGYGMPDAKAAMGALGARRFARGAVAQEEVKEFEIEVPAGTPVLRVLAAWDDHEGWPGGWRALVNDLDL